MGYDVDIPNLANLLSVANTSVYPANTDGTTGNGGIDLAAVNGHEIHEIPEPGTGACSLLALGGLTQRVFCRGLTGFSSPRRAASSPASR